MKSLDKCNLGDKVVIKKINASNSIKRRLLDIGLIPGTIIEIVLKSPSGDPFAYNIRGSLISLRKEDTKNIEVDDYYE